MDNKENKKEDLRKKHPEISEFWIDCLVMTLIAKEELELDQNQTLQVLLKLLS